MNVLFAILGAIISGTVSGIATYMVSQQRKAAMI
jgi:hypothetical protein